MDIIKISLKNVLYNKSRAIRTFLILSFGALMYTYASALLGGMLNQSVKESVLEESADIRIRVKNFDEDIPYSETNFFKANDDALKNTESIKYTERILVSGEMDDYEKSLPIVIIGIDKNKDREIFTIPGVEGKEYPNEADIWVGAVLANQMGVKEGDYINISFRSYEGVYVSGEYRISALTKSSMPLYSEQSIFIDIEEMKNLFSDTMTSYYSIKVDNKKELEKVASELKKLYPDNSVLTWKEVLSELFFNIEIRLLFMGIFLAIIMFVALLGLSNSVLISAWEKRKTTAMMRAMGFYDKDIILLFVFEAVCIALLGALVGVIISAIINIPSSIIGFDMSGQLSVNGESLDVGFYIPPVMKSSWDIKHFLVPVILMPLSAAIISYFPARKSVQMSIVEGIRTRD